MRRGVSMLLLTGMMLLAAHIVAGAAGAPSVAPEEIWSTEQQVSGRRGFVAAITGRASTSLFDRPYAAAWSETRLYVTDPGRSSVVALEKGRHPLRSRDGSVTSPVGIAVCGDSVLVSDSERGVIVAFSPDLQESDVVVTGLGRPTGIACLDHRVFVLETGEHRVLEVADGRVVARFGVRGDGDGEFNFPTLLAVRNRELLVGDAMNFRLQRLTPDGVPLATFGELGDAPGSMPRMKGLAVDGEGNLWMTDAWLDRVAVFDVSGRFLLDVGRPGTGPGEFSFPAGIAIHRDGRVAVVDSYNARVQILRLSFERERK